MGCGKMEYNSFRQLTTDYQEHAAVVSVGTSPKVGYGYDRLHRLVDFDRGKLIRDDDLIDPLVRKAQWTLDATGNWSRFRRSDQHDADAALDQTRGHNGANEVTGIAETVGRVWASPTHDRAGNMLVIPRPSDPRESYTATYDAWHRLVKLEQSDGAGGLEPVAAYAYDGRNFRIVKQTYAAGELIATRHFYYSSQWQVLEERVDDSQAADCQYVWGERYIDDLVLRDRDTTADGLLDERFYALQDANWNVIAISDPDCQIQERYAYDAYGTPAVHNGAFTPIATTAYAWPYTYTGRRLDEESGLMYYRNRMYHVELGRFVTRDPVGYEGEDLNLYRYVGSTPTNAHDPSGYRILSFINCSHAEQTALTANDLAVTTRVPSIIRENRAYDFTEAVNWASANMRPSGLVFLKRSAFELYNRNMSHVLDRLQRRLTAGYDACCTNHTAVAAAGYVLLGLVWVDNNTIYFDHNVYFALAPNALPSPTLGGLGTTQENLLLHELSHLGDRGVKDGNFDWVPRPGRPGNPTNVPYAGGTRIVPDEAARDAWFIQTLQHNSVQSMNEAWIVPFMFPR